MKIGAFSPHLSLRPSFLESLLQPESLRLDWLLLAVSQDAPPSTSTVDEEGDPRYRRSPLSKLWWSFRMEAVYSHVVFWAYCRSSYGRDWLQSGRSDTKYFVVTMNTFWVTDPVRIWWFLSEKCTSRQNLAHDSRELNWPLMLFHGSTLRALGD